MLIRRVRRSARNIVCIEADKQTLSNEGHYYAAAVLLGACWHQVTFAVHDAGHTEITGSYHSDRVIGSLIASWFGGLSCGWWSDVRSCHF